MNSTSEFLTHPLLSDAGVAHGFGQLGSLEPAGVIRPFQQHAAGVAFVREECDTDPGQADAIVSSVAGVPVGVMTVVPVELTSPSSLPLQPRAPTRATSAQGTEVWNRRGLVVWPEYMDSPVPQHGGDLPSGVELIVGRRGVVRSVDGRCGLHASALIGWTGTT